MNGKGKHVAIARRIPGIIAYTHSLYKFFQAPPKVTSVGELKRVVAAQGCRATRCSARLLQHKAVAAQGCCSTRQHKAVAKHGCCSTRLLWHKAIAAQLPAAMASSNMCGPMENALLNLSGSAGCSISWPCMTSQILSSDTWNNLS